MEWSYSELKPPWLFGIFWHLLFHLNISISEESWYHILPQYPAWEKETGKFLRFEKWRLGNSYDAQGNSYEFLKYKLGNSRSLNSGWLKYSLLIGWNKSRVCTSGRGRAVVISCGQHFKEKGPTLDTGQREVSRGIGERVTFVRLSHKNHLLSPKISIRF